MNIFISSLMIIGLIFLAGCAGTSQKLTFEKVKVAREQNFKNNSN